MAGAGFTGGSSTRWRPTSPTAGSCAASNSDPSCAGAGARLDLTTVTRAYGEARRRGLLDAQVGRGTFVSETTARAAEISPTRQDRPFDEHPAAAGRGQSRRAHRARARAIRDESGFSAFLNYQRPGGSEMSATLPRSGCAACAGRAARAPDRLSGQPGDPVQRAVSLTSPGDVVLTEALTFPGMKAAAQTLGVRLVGVEMDAEGILPDALKCACRRTSRRRSTWSHAAQSDHRDAVAEPERGGRRDRSAKQHFLIEDDAYGWLAPSLAPIANLIPERTYLAVGLSKCIAPALRVSYLLVPDAGAEQTMRGRSRRRCRCRRRDGRAGEPWMAPAWRTRSCRDPHRGAAPAARRPDLKAVAMRRLAGHHLWLPLPRRWNRADFVAPWCATVSRSSPRRFSVIRLRRPCAVARRRAEPR